MIQIWAVAAVTGLAALAPVTGTTPDPNLAYYQTFTTSAEDGDPGSATLAIVVSEATDCDNEAGIGDLVPDVVLSVDREVLYDSRTTPDDGSAFTGAVLNAGGDTLLAYVPVDGLAPENGQATENAQHTAYLTLDCIGANGAPAQSWTGRWENPGFADLPSFMPGTTAEEGAPLTVYDLQAVYGQTEVDPAAVLAEIDGTAATVAAGEASGSVAVRAATDLPAGLHLVTLVVNGQELTAPFLQKGTNAAAPSETSAAADSAGAWPWWVAGAGGLLALLVLVIVVVRRRRAR